MPTGLLRSLHFFASRKIANGKITLKRYKNCVIEVFDSEFYI